MSTVTKARAYHHGDLRAALVRAALQLARKEGAAGVTLRGVARAAGVSEAAPYHHFRDRRDLLAAAAAEGFRGLASAVAEARAHVGSAGDADAVLVAVSCAYVRFAVEHRGPMRLILGAHVVDEGLSASAELRDAAAPVVSVLRDAVARALPDATPAARRRFEHMAWAQLHGVVSLVVEKELKPLPTADEAARLAGNAVRLLARGTRVSTELA